MSSIINGFILFSLTITVAYLVGLLVFINDHEENLCDMTYMFEYPQYVRIYHEIDEKYPQYGLYAYSEGAVTGKARNMFFDGIPVLFIPGNAGSFKQARSLSSIALRKALNSRTPYHFDYFLADLNHELSGLNGGLLADQLEYVNSSIYKILSLYAKRNIKRKSVVIYAHSMGGVIARRLVAGLPEGSDLIPIVLTLSAPHRRPPLMLDAYTFEFYKGMDNYPSNTTFVSITGGYSDFLVPSYLTSVLDDDSLNIVTTHVPRVWLPVDHVCILWCKQLILALNRALFDSVDAKTKQISTDHQFRKRVFHHHLVHHSGINIRLFDSYSLKANIRNEGEWIEYLERQYTVNIPRHSKTAFFYMIRLVNQPQHEALVVQALNLETVDWVFVCGAHIPKRTKRVCEEFTPLTHLSEISPSGLYKRRTLRINMHDLIKNNSDWTHVVVRVLPSDENVVLNVDVHNNADRTLEVTLPNMFMPKRHVLIKETHEKAMHYEMKLSNLNHVMQSYQLYIDTVQCVNEIRHAVASFITPWAHQTQHKYFLWNDSRPLHVRLSAPRPQWASNQSAVIRLTLDPNCRYKVSIRSSISGVLGQMARFYSPLLVVNVAAVVLMTLNSQLKSIAQDRECSLFFVAIKEGAKPYYILTSVKLVARVLSAKQFTTLLPAPDWLITSQEGTDFFLLPLLLYICSVGIVWMLGIGLFVALVVCETTVHKLTLKFLAKTVSFNVSWSDYVMSALHKIPFVVAGTLISLSMTTTGSLALCVGMIFYFLRLTQMSQDYIEELVWYYLKKIGQRLKKKKNKQKPETKDAQPSTSKQNKDNEIEKKDDNSNNNNNNVAVSVHDAMFFHATLFILWSILTIINVPSVLTWAHNFKDFYNLTQIIPLPDNLSLSCCNTWPHLNGTCSRYSTALKSDPSFIPGLLLSVCALPLWQLELPKIERKGYTEIGQFIAVLAVASLIYAPISIFRLNYTITAAIVVVTLHQLIAPNRVLTNENYRPDPPFLSFEALKAKLE